MRPATTGRASEVDSTSDGEGLEQPALVVRADEAPEEQRSAGGAGADGGERDLESTGPNVDPAFGEDDEEPAGGAGRQGGEELNDGEAGQERVGPVKPWEWNLYARPMSRPSRNDIRLSAQRFAGEWAGETQERAEAQTFWTEFLLIFGVNRRGVRAAFERHARRGSTGGAGFIDLLWPNMLLAEHKSGGHDLDKAMDQALDYIDSLEDVEKPRLLVVCNFHRMRVLDLDDQEPAGGPFEFLLDELPEHIDRFLSLAGYSTRRFDDEDPVNIEAAEILGRVHIELEASGYPLHELGIVTVRLLFVLFGDDAGLWPRNQFADFLRDRTAEDGSDLGMWLNRLFDVLDTPDAQRTRSLDEDLAEFPYVNGGLFSERVLPTDTTRATRSALLEACTFDWSQISPAIFGSMFQSIMDRKARRQIGAQYTAERNIMKVIEPLFLDDLRAELAAAGRSRQRLTKLHEKLGGLTVLDPACGCGNFLVIAYRELRRIELEVLDRLHPGNVQQVTDIQALRKVDVSQFFGIEIEEFPCRIAETAMYLVDHLENERLGLRFGINVVDLPLQATATISNKNALLIDWNDVLSAERCAFVLGNPPFVGKKARTPVQKDDMTSVFGATTDLDYVAAWYIKTVEYLGRRDGRAAFVSTNSIAQGEQVPELWSQIFDAGYRIDFAHRTFKWVSEARGRAHVHCVIVGFSYERKLDRRIYDYPDVAGDPIERLVPSINHYLSEGPAPFVPPRRKSLVGVPPASFGSMPNDGGHLLLPAGQVEVLTELKSDAVQFVRPLASARQMVNGEDRFCLWLVGVEPSTIKASSFVRERVEKVKKYREASTRPATRRLAATPALFGEIRQPSVRYLCIPRHTTETRTLVPMAFYDPEVIASDSTLFVAGADLVLFGFLQSAMFNTWQRTVGGRIKSDLRVSVEMVYNTFPFPEPTAVQAAAIESAAQAVLDARESFDGRSLAELYDPLATPPALIAAHRALDVAVNRSFGKRQALVTDSERLAVLFARYEQLIADRELPGLGPRLKNRRRT